MNQLRTLCTLLLLSPAAAAQATLIQLDGAAALDAHATVLGGVDFTFDGVPDPIVGAPLEGPADAGAVYRYSGADGSELSKWSLANPNQWFGASLAWLHDINGDGVPEFAVGAPYYWSGSAIGAVYVFSTVGPGSLLFTLFGDEHLAGFGTSVTGGFDWNADGTPDIAVGAPFRDSAGVDAGSVFVYDGLTGIFMQLKNGTSGDLFGWSVEGVSDISGDGFDDLLVGAPAADAPGRPDAGFVQAYRSIGFTAWSRLGVNAGDNFGYSLASLGDMDQNGRGDFAVGAPNWDNGAVADAGHVDVFSSLASVAQFTGTGTDEWLGFSLSAIDDLDGDLVPELCIGAPQNDLGASPGYAEVFDPLTLTSFVKVSGDVGGELAGWSVGNAGDVNGDGVGDLLVGAYNGLGPNGNAGWVRVASSACGAFVSYCTSGVSASGCSPTLSASGVPSASAASGFLVTASLVEGDKTGLFFFGTNGRQANPWGSGTSYQCVVPPVKRGGLLAGSGAAGFCNGNLTQDMSALWQAKPAHNPGPASVVQLQCWYRDPFNTSNQSTSLTDAIEILVCP